VFLVCVCGPVLFFRLAQTLHRIGTDSRVHRHRRRRRRRTVLPWFTKYPYYRRRRRELLLPLHKLEGDCNRARTHAKTHICARNILDTHSLARTRYTLLQYAIIIIFKYFITVSVIYFIVLSKTSTSRW